MLAYNWLLAVVRHLTSVHDDITDQLHAPTASIPEGRATGNQWTESVRAPHKVSVCSLSVSAFNEAGRVSDLSARDDGVMVNNNELEEKWKEVAVA